jgi:4-amino-4-deoxy-L-arabinose transferase-like glycosyltransferase
MISAFGGGVLWLVTRWGIGLTPDAMMYIGSARGVLAGQGLAMRIDYDRYNPLINYAPGFPLLLAGLSKVGLGTPLEAARPGQAMLFAANIFLAACLARRAGGSAWAGIFAAAIMLLSPHVIRVHANALAEPLFILFCLGGMGFLGAYLHRPTSWRFIAAAACLVLSYFARYAGLAFIGAGVVAMLLWSEGPARQRVLRALKFALIMAIPVALWMARNAVVGTSAGRPLVWHPISVRHWLGAWNTVRQWLVPSGLSGSLVRESVICGAGVAAVAAVLSYKQRRSVDPAVAAEGAPLRRVAGLAVGAYFAFLVVSISLFDFDTPMDLRILAPALVGALIAVAGTAAAWAPRHPAFRLLALAAALTLLPLYTCSAAIEYALLFREGTGYASPQWIHNEVLAAARALPTSLKLHTNAPDVLALLADRPSIRLPTKRFPITQKPNPSYQRQMQDVAESVRQGKAVIIYFHGFSEKRPTLPLEKELLAQMSLRAITDVKSGRIYQWSTPATQAAP